MQESLVWIGGAQIYGRQGNQWVSPGCRASSTSGHPAMDVPLLPVFQVTLNNDCSSCTLLFWGPASLSKALLFTGPSPEAGLGPPLRISLMLACAGPEEDPENHPCLGIVSALWRSQDSGLEEAAIVCGRVSALIPGSQAHQKRL